MKHLRAFVFFFEESSTAVFYGMNWIFACGEIDHLLTLLYKNDAILRATRPWMLNNLKMYTEKNVSSKMSSGMIVVITLVANPLNLIENISEQKCKTMFIESYLINGIIIKTYVTNWWIFKMFVCAWPCLDNIDRYEWPNKMLLGISIWWVRNVMT